MKTKIFKAKLKDLKPTENNPRQISKDDFRKLKKSLQEFPEMEELREIVVDEDMRILGGHQRVKALLENGETEATVKQAIGLTDEQKAEFVVKDNILNGDWDFDKLLESWDVDDLQEWGLDNIKKSIKDEKDIKEDPPTIITSFITFDYEDEIQLEITDETATKLMEEMLAYNEKNSGYKGFWDERLK